MFNTPLENHKNILTERDFVQKPNQQSIPDRCTSTVKSKLKRNFPDLKFPAEVYMKETCMV